MKRVKVKKTEIIEKITNEYINVLKKVLQLPDEPEFVRYLWDHKKIKYTEKRTTKKDVLDNFFMFSPVLQKSTLDGQPYLLG